MTFQVHLMSGIVGITGPHELKWVHEPSFTFQPRWPSSAGLSEWPKPTF
jgi:hypothetical protein